jgi:hypothetical protein
MPALFVGMGRVMSRHSQSRETHALLHTPLLKALSILREMTGHRPNRRVVSAGGRAIEHLKPYSADAKENLANASIEN